VRQFGGAHYALASYNAGENRIARWIAERPGIDQDEWIDDIPFPETQNYVKRILGTAEDYRKLYSSEPASADGNDATPAVSHDNEPAVATKASAATGKATTSTKKKASSKKTKKAA